MREMTRVTLERNFQQPGLFSLWIYGDCPIENSTLTVSELLSTLDEYNVIDYHEVSMIHPDPRYEVCEDCHQIKEECECSCKVCVHCDQIMEECMCN